MKYPIGSVIRLKCVSKVKNYQSTVDHLVVESKYNPLDPTHQILGLINLHNFKRKDFLIETNSDKFSVGQFDYQILKLKEEKSVNQDPKLIPQDGKTYVLNKVSYYGKGKIEYDEDLITIDSSDSNGVIYFSYVNKQGSNYIDLGIRNLTMGLIPYGVQFIYLSKQ